MKQKLFNSNMVISRTNAACKIKKQESLSTPYIFKHPAKHPKRKHVKENMKYHAG